MKVSLLLVLCSFLVFADEIKVLGSKGSVITEDGLCAVVGANSSGGFTQGDINWEAAAIRQIEFRLKSNRPGYFRLNASCTIAGKRKFVSIDAISVIPDGEYRNYVYDCTVVKDWKGVVGGWELRWMGEEAEIGLKEVRISPINNRLAFADSLTTDTEVRLQQLMPRAKCRIRWDGLRPGKACVHFYDREMKPLPETVTMQDAKPVDFTTPEMMIYATFTLLENGEGFPVVEQLEYVKPFAMPFEWRGYCIWSQTEPGPMNRRVWFKRVIELDDKPKFAVMAVGGDDRCYTYVNGKFMGRTSRWRDTGRYEITNLLKSGKNTILCSVHNDLSWGGFWGNVYIQTEKGEILVDTDDKWTCDPDSNIDTALPTDISKPVCVLGPTNAAMPWKGRMMLKFAGKRGAMEALSLRPGVMKVRILEEPLAIPQRLEFAVKQIGGKGVEQVIPIPIIATSDNWKSGTELEIMYKLPYTETGMFSVYLDDPLLELRGNPEIMRIDNSQAQPPPIKKAQFVKYPRPMLKFGEELINPIFWHAANDMSHDHSTDWLFTRQCGFRSYRISAAFHDYWKQDGSFDFANFDKRVAQLLLAVPDAVFAVHVYAYMPEWWLAKNPDDTSRHYKTGKRFMDLDKQALSSKKWLKEAEVPLKALIDHIKASRFADRVWGMSFAENINGEWFWGSEDSNYKTSHAGFSKADLLSFRSFLRGKYKTDAALVNAWKMPDVTFETAQLPDPERPRKGTVGIFFDPEKDMQVLDWFEYRSAALSDAIIHFGKFAKEQSDNNWLTGAYFGYVVQLMPSGWRPIQIVGHNGFLEVAKSPYIDFVHAPLGYKERRTGQPGMIMQMADTWLLRGKTLYIEEDVRTVYGLTGSNIANKTYSGDADTAFEDIGQLNREFGISLATGAINYWYDLIQGGFNEKAMHDVLREQNDVYAKLPPVKGITPVEAAIVLDRDSLYYTQYGNSETPYSNVLSLFMNFNRLAIPYHAFSTDELLSDDVSCGAHKVYVMLPMLKLSAEQRQAMMRRFEKEKATVLWLYAAGPFYAAKGPLAENCCDFLGLRVKMINEKMRPTMKTVPEYGGLLCENPNESTCWFLPESGYDKIIGADSQGKPLCVEKTMNGAKHIFCSLMDLPPQFYECLLNNSGVFRYAQNIGDCYWIGNDVLFLYAGQNGKKTLSLSKGSQAKAIIGPFKGTLRDGESFEATAGMTYGFLISTP